MFFQLVAAYAIFILALALPPLVALCLLWVIGYGLKRIFAALGNHRRIDLVGLGLVIASLAIGALAYDWWCGPKAELATLQPVKVDRELAAKVPRTCVYDWGAAFAVFDLLPAGRADRVLNARGAMAGGKTATDMEEVHIVDSPECKAYVAGGQRDANRALRCTRSNPVSKADLDAAGPYLYLHDEHHGEVHSLAYAVVRHGSVVTIARCQGRAPRETNPFLALIRWSRSREVARSIYACQQRAASGGLARVLATGKIG